MLSSTNFILLGYLISTSLGRVIKRDDTSSSDSVEPDSVFGSIRHYPPVNNNFNDLDKLFDASTGTNGGIYNTSFVPEESYGVYDFCNMPHLRPTEYVIPEGFTLEYVEIMHRHHKRTPYASNLFPKEDLSLYCDDVSNYYYAQPKSEDSYDAVRISWENFQDPVNPFSYSNTGYNGSCQFPQISYAGLIDSHQHGVDLYNLYGNKLGFLPKKYDPNVVRYRATSNVITSQVASAVVKGMFPDEEDVPILVQRIASDSLEPQYPCSFADDVRSNYQHSDEWYEHLNKSKSLYEELDAISGVDPKSSGWHSWFDHYFDNFAFRLCHQQPLPCNLNNRTDCVSLEQAEQVFRLGDYEYNYIFREAKNSTLYAATHYGVYLLELKSHIENKIAGTESLIYRHNIAHDGSIAPLLGGLQISYLRWPGMGAEVSFELWKKQVDGNYYIRVLYGGQPLETTGPLGNIDLIEVDKFLAYIDTLTGENGKNVVSLCTSS